MIERFNRRVQVTELSRLLIEIILYEDTRNSWHNQ